MQTAALGGRRENSRRRLAIVAQRDDAESCFMKEG